MASRKFIAKPKAKANAKTRKKSVRVAPTHLLIAAHPDDETLFFSGILFKHAAKLKVICVTDGDGDGQGATRIGQWHRAMDLFGVRDREVWGLPDRFDDRLDIATMHARLSAQPKFKQVFTHAPAGEYGHPHHQDVSHAVHSFYLSGAIKPAPQVWIPAYNCYAQKLIRLTPAQYALKSRVLTAIYGSETRRFLHFLDNASIEGYASVKREEAQAIYQAVTQTQPLNPKALKVFAWYRAHLEEFHARRPVRPF